MYCEVYPLRDDDPYYDEYLALIHNEGAALYRCFNPDTGWNDYFWEGSAAPAVDPETVVRTSLTSLGLHPPTVGVGAFTYPGDAAWGLSWWVGAPMWLWVDSTDHLQWGAHTLSASEGGLTVSAAVQPSSVAYDMGDGSRPITCHGPGTPRPWDPDDLLSNHSPSGCEYTYTTINRTGDPPSRYTITATVTWQVDWSASDGQTGSFATQMTSASPTSVHIGELHVVRVPTP